MRNPVWHHDMQRRWVVFIADRENCGRWWRCSPAVSLRCPSCGEAPYYPCRGASSKAVATCHPSRLQAYRDAGKPGEPVDRRVDETPPYPFPGIGRNP